MLNSSTALSCKKTQTIPNVYQQENGYINCGIFNNKIVYSSDKFLYYSHMKQYEKITE